MENLQLEQWGNRVPQFTFEVIRPAQPENLDAPASLADVVQGVAMLPGSGEYALATTPVYRPAGSGGVANQAALFSAIRIFLGIRRLARRTGRLGAWVG